MDKQKVLPPNVKLACDLVERYLRTLGPNVTLTVTPQGVEVADDSWSGGSPGATIHEALEDAMYAIQIGER